MVAEDFTIRSRNGFGWIPSAKAQLRKHNHTQCTHNMFVVHDLHIHNVHTHTHTYTHMHTHVHTCTHRCTQMHASVLWRERGSNPRRADYDSTVLPTELSRQRVVQYVCADHAQQTAYNDIT